MNNRLNKQIKTIKIVLILLIIIAASFYINVLISGSKTDSIIDDFKDRGIYQYTLNDIEYYKVNKMYDFEDANKVLNGDYIGTTGDIYLCSSDPFGGFTTKFISKKIRIGHGAIVSSELGDKTYEIYGNVSKTENIVKERDNEWLNKSLKEYIVLRVKDINNDDKTNIQNALINNSGKKYNYFYLNHSKNRYYCIDLITLIYKEIGINIDNNKTLSTGSSIINNGNTYLIYYMCEIDGIKRVYYLSEE